MPQIPQRTFPVERNSATPHINRSWENPTRIESALDNRVVAIFLEPPKDIYGEYMRILFVRLHRMEQQIRTLNLLYQVAMPAGEPEDH
jgi:hypothetical protein